MCTPFVFGGILISHIFSHAQKSTPDLNRICVDTHQLKPDTLSLTGVHRMISITQPTAEPSPRTSIVSLAAPAGSADVLAAATYDHSPTAPTIGGDEPPRTRHLQTPVITEENEFGDPPHKSSISLQVEPSADVSDTHTNQGGTGNGCTTVATVCPDGTPSSATTRRKLSVQGLMAFAERRRSSSTFSELRKMSISNGGSGGVGGSESTHSVHIRSAGGMATPGGPPTRSRPSSKMTKYVECWGADKPFANITDSTMAKNIGLASIAMIESNLLPPERRCSQQLLTSVGGCFGGCCGCLGPPTELRPVTMWYRDAEIERAYRDKPDPHFRYDLICSFIMFVALAVLQLVVVKPNVAVLGSMGATLCTLSLFVYLSHAQMGSESSRNCGDRDGGPGQVIVQSRAVRMVMFGVTNALIAACAVFSVINFEESIEVETYMNATTEEGREPRLEFRALTSQSQSTETAPVYLLCCALSLASISAFLKAGFVLKFVTMATCIGVQGAVLWNSNLFRMYAYGGK